MARNVIEHIFFSKQSTIRAVIETNANVIEIDSQVFPQYQSIINFSVIEKGLL